MNNSTSNSSSGLFNSPNVGGFGYGIGVSIGILLLITTITVTSYFCNRTQLSGAQTQQGRGEPSDQHTIAVEEGLDEATLKSFPKVPYSQARLSKKDTTASCCSICLADYKGTDMLRLLPDCGHLFHVPCVDPWLRLHPTCPICRSSPIPTPLSTPLAEVVPLSSRPG